MPLPLRKKTVFDRLQSYPLGNYLYIGSIMKGVTFAAATLVLVQLVADVPSTWSLLSPWLGSLLLTLVSYMTWGSGILLTNSRSNYLDSILPMMLGMTEIFLFVILSPLETNDLWRWWFFVASAHALIAACLVFNRIKMTSLSDDFHPELFDLASKYRHWMSNDLKGALGGMVLAALLGVLWVIIIPTFDSGVWSKVTYCILVVPLIVIYGAVILAADRQRNEIDRSISQLMRDA